MDDRDRPSGSTFSVATVREEHERFVPYVEDIRRAADSIGRASAKRVLGRLDEIHEFLAHRLIPHAVAEGRLILPLVRAVPGGEATAVGMNQCHVQLGRFTDDLEEAVERTRRIGMNSETERELRRILYGLHALLTAHFAQAEEVFTAAVEPGRTRPERAAFFDEVERSAQDVSDAYE